MHLALRRYKDGLPTERSFASPRLAAILWKFLARHEHHVLEAVGSRGFHVVTTVPSSTEERDRTNRLREVVGIVGPVAERADRLLRPAGEVTGRDFDINCFQATKPVDGKDVLLIDDTWTRGGHAQSAAYTLKQAGARRVGMVVIGRHLRPDWEVTDGRTSADLYDALPKRFDWERCAVCAH